jgi:transcriptional regulator with XRE-family HTH domain
VTTRDEYAAMLRRVRLDAGTPSYRDLARDLAISHTTVGHILKGKHFPRQVTHNALTSHLTQLSGADRVPLDEAWVEVHETEKEDLVGSPRSYARVVNAGPTALGYKVRFLILAELEASGQTQAWLAQQAELSQKHVSQLLNARAPMSMEIADRLLGALGREFTVGTAPTFGEPAYENWVLA